MKMSVANTVSNEVTVLRGVTCIICTNAIISANWPRRQNRRRKPSRDFNPWCGIWNQRFSVIGCNLKRRKRNWLPARSHSTDMKRRKRIYRNSLPSIRPNSKTRPTSSTQRSRNWSGWPQMRQKHVQLFSRSATTKLISCHLKLPRKYPCSVLTNGSSGRTNVLPSSLPKLSAR